MEGSGVVKQDRAKNHCSFQLCRASLVAQMVQNLPAMWETQVLSLSWEDPLKKGMATHFSILELPRQLRH